ncbi:MAG: chemotaxis protein CheW [Oscillospiraceae bacterium]
MFKINDVMYAVNGSMINSIFVLEQPVTCVPMTESHVRGIINVRGDIVPIVDMRVLFELPTAEQNYQEFKKMIEDRKQDHLNWVEALRNYIENDVPFKLATDPHECAFGKWYDTFETNDPSVIHYLRQVEEPHNKLHACAEEAINCKRNCDECKREECLKVILKSAFEIYVPNLLKLIDHVREAYSASSKQMVIVLQEGAVQMGILVDEVVEVTDINEIFSLKEMPNTHRSPFVYGVGTVEHIEKEILMLDVSAVVKCS